MKRIFRNTLWLLGGYLLATLLGIALLKSAEAAIYVKDDVTIKKLDKIDKVLLKYKYMDIVITSAYRDKARNKQVGGKHNSKHLIPGAARDLRLIAPYDKLLPKLLRKHGFKVIEEKDHMHVEIL